MKKTGKLLLSFAIGAILACFVAQNTYAVSGSFVDGNGVEWLYEEKNITTARATGNSDYCSGNEKIDTMSLVIGIKSVPTNATTVVLPSFSEAVNMIGDQSLLDYDTYYVDNLLGDVQADSLPATLNKVDMSNANKVQIKSLAPLFDGRDNQIELVFGEGVVIADNQTITTSSCGDNERVDFSYESGAFEGLNLKVSGLNNIKYFGWRAFKDATFDSSSLSVEIGNNQTVGGKVFEGTNVSSISIDAKEVGEDFCRSCAGLTSLTIGENVETLYGGAFRGTSSLSVDFDSKNIKKIGGFAFYQSGIKSAVFNSKAEVIDTMAFAETNLDSLDFTGISSRIGALAFYDAGLESIELGDLSAIDTAAFVKNNLTNVYLPKSIKYVGASVFAGNPVEEVTVAYDPLALMNFSGEYLNTGLLFRTFFSGVDGAISMYVDYGQIEVRPIDYVADSITHMKKLNIEAPYGADDVVPERGNIYETSALDYIGEVKNLVPYHYFEDFGPYLEEINIGEGIEFIDNQAFYMSCISVGFGCQSGGGNKSFTGEGERGPNVSSLNFPSTLRGIGSNAFMHSLNNENLVFDNLPESLLYIGSQAFYMNTSMQIKNLDLPNIKYIGPSAFACVKITNLTIRDSIERIEHAAFVGNYDLKSITIDTDIFGKKNGQNIISRFNDVFIGNMYTSFTTLSLIPDIRNGSYKADNRGEYYRFHLDKITFTEKSVTSAPLDQGTERLYVDDFDASAAKWTSIPGFMFWAGKIKQIELPSTLEEIGIYAFMRTELQDTLVLPEGLKKIDDYAFWGDLIYDDGYVYDGAPAVNRDAVIVKIDTLPSTLEEIGSYAFYHQRGLTADLNAPNLKKLGDQPFKGSNVHNVLLPNTIEDLGSYVLFDTPNLNDVTIDTDLYDGYTSGYDTFVWSVGDRNHKLGVLTFTENAGEPFGGFASYNGEYTTEQYACGNPIECGKDYAYFYGLNAAKVDLGATDWTILAPSMFQESQIDEIILPNNLEMIGEDVFYKASLGNVVLPSTLKVIAKEGFQEATANITELPEGLSIIDDSAFYAADVTDNLVIPSTVTFMGVDSFNAGPNDVHYDTVTLKPALTFANTDNMLMHQIFWNADVDELVIESSNLPALNANVEAGQQEFWSMPFDKVTIKNLPGISYGAFEGCDQLVEVDASENAALRDINDEAFLNAEKLHIFKFSPDVKNETITVGKNAFKGTAFETMGDSTKEFDLTAAKFDGSKGYAFSGMPKLRSVDVPRTYSNATIPRASFYDDPELAEATLDYKITEIYNAAFANDDKLERIFIWGDTAVEDKNIGGYTMPTRAPDDTVGDAFGPTIPESTDIYAYSANVTEAYAGFDGPRQGFEGKFYPLDEVIYITSNKPRVKLNDERDDFDKSELVVYGMRRDGIILESDDWKQYDGVAYPRSTVDIEFEKMAPTIAERPEFGTIWDTPVPLDELNMSNTNFEEIEYTLVRDDESDLDHVRIVNIVYTDKYTRGLPDTDIDPYDDNPVIPDPIEDLIEDITGPVTLGESIAVYVVILGASIAGVIAISKKKQTA